MAGKLVILSGPSGVGKDTLIDAWRQRDPRVERVVATCTRAPRPGEVDGVDYTFIDLEGFHRLAEGGHFLEYKQVHGNWYATPREGVDRRLAEGKIVILKIDVQGAMDVMKERPDALSIFVLPPSDEELERRIRDRGQDDEEAIQKRLAAARAEIACSGHYEYKVVNQEVDATVRRLMEIVGA